jgi:hypothetical protein
MLTLETRGDVVSGAELPPPHAAKSKEKDEAKSADKNFIFNTLSLKMLKF